MWPFTRKADAVPAKRSFEAAAGGRRWEGGGWVTSVNADVAAGASTIRARARHAVANDPHAARAVEAWASNLVGTGLVPQSSAAPGVREAIDAVFDAWSKDADASGRSDFYGIQALVARELMTAGEAFIRFRPRLPEDGLAVPLQLQILDPAQIDAGFHRDLAGGFTIRSGIEFDAIGRRTAYYVHRTDALGGASLDATRVPADDVLHVFQQVAPGQIRGVSRLASVLLRLRDLDGLQDAALMRAKVEALVGAFITGDSELFEGTQTGSILETGLEPGALKILPPGSDIKFSDPKSGGANYEAFVGSQLRAIAAGLGLTYEQISGDMRNVNYSSARVALIEFRRSIEAFRSLVLTPQMLEPVWRRVLSVAELAGVLPADADDAVTWVAPCWDWVDPLKDTQANIAAVEAGFKSRRQVISEYGRDPDQVAAEIAEEAAA